MLTDTDVDAKRITEIVRALDGEISGISSVRVLPLAYADAKDLAAEIKELFPPPSTSRNGGPGPGGFGPMRFMARFAGAMAAANNSSQSEAKEAQTRVLAVADERTNALIVNAPDEVLAVIEQLVKKIDQEAQNITVVKAFHLKNADPSETADVLNNLFPEQT